LFHNIVSLYELHTENKIFIVIIIIIIAAWQSIPWAIVQIPCTLSCAVGWLYDERYKH